MRGDVHFSSVFFESTRNLNLDTAGNIPEVILVINLKQLLNTTSNLATEKSSRPIQGGRCSDSDIDPVLKDTKDLKMPKDLQKHREASADTNLCVELTEGIQKK
jgi:hypothetical protein